jgi:hypothetical protein
MTASRRFSTRKLVQLSNHRREKMKLIHLSNLVGKGLLVAGLVSLPLALPATANTTATADDRLAQTTSDDGTSDSRDINYYPAMNDYQIGRHGMWY